MCDQFKSQSYEDQYFDQLINIGTNGYISKGRNGNTKKLPHCYFTVNLWEEVPILTSRKMYWTTAIKELLWMFRDHSNDVSKLQEQNCHIWDLWADENNTIGKSYGYQVNMNNQFDNLLHDLKYNDQSRRMILDLWNVNDLQDMTLPPCVYSTIWDVVDVPTAYQGNGNCYQNYPGPGKYLNCFIVQRSGDLPIGVPTDILEYAILTHMLAQVSELQPGVLRHSISNCHIYENQLIKASHHILRRNDRPINNAKIWVNEKINNFYDFTFDDIKIIGYDSLDVLKYPVSE